MPPFTPQLIWLSALSFFVYGTSCVFTRHMRLEFERFGLARQRVIVGWTQLAGAVGLLLGFHLPGAGALAAGGLAVQMLLGVGVRLVIRDTLWQAMPAAFYLVLNAYLCVVFLQAVL